MEAIRVSVVAAVAATTLAACGSGDSTVAKTPEPTTPRTVVATAVPAPPPAPPPTPPPVAAPSTTIAQPADPCSVNLAAPEIAKAAAALPPDPRSKQRWSAEPIAGNYNECAQLSTVVVKANTNADNPNTRAIMFHQGKFIPTGVPDTFGFNGIDASQSTGDTIALKYSNGIPGLDSIVRFRWNGGGVELIGNVPAG
ncbi:MAG TPA: LppP/LprE family lipoprotein [Mycobacterium sp.]|nr:LppP/LprE family lipoprotein [Mycobacterium sp.]HZA10528.1 LppP/LprE family lipoprotein [Mycobacterium sp.]